MRANACKQLDVEVRDQLLAFLKRRYGRAWVNQAINEFADGQDSTDAEETLLWPWILYHRHSSDHDERAVAAVWREEHRLYREPAKDRLVAAQLSASIGVWEVQSVVPGVGSQLTDLLSGEERFAYDASSTESMQPWLGLLGFVVDCDDISFFGGLHAQPLPPEETARVVKAIRRHARVRTKPVPLAYRCDPDMHVELVAAWREGLHQLRHKFDDVTLQNTDGDLIAPQTDHFVLRAPREVVVRRLARIAGAQPPDTVDGDVEIVIHRNHSPSDPMPGGTVIGRILVSPFHLKVETNSVERAFHLRSQVEDACDDAVRFERRESESLESMRSAMHAPAPDSSRSFVDPRAESSPEAQAVVREFYRQHTATWVDIELPALNGMTPRAAAKDKRMRPRLEILLKDIEQKESSSPPGMRMDIRAIRRALNL